MTGVVPTLAAPLLIVGGGGTAEAEGGGGGGTAACFARNKLRRGIDIIDMHMRRYIKTEGMYIIHATKKQRGRPWGLPLFAK